MPAEPDPQTPQRRFRRLKANLLTRIARRQELDLPSAGNVTNLSLGGVFIEVVAPYPVGTEVELEFQLPGTELQVRAVGNVVWTEFEVGMGIEFTSVSSESREKLRGYLAQSGSGPGAQPPEDPGSERRKPPRGSGR